jgi:soluble lytic murein transglycosylase-like protein
MQLMGATARELGFSEEPAQLCAPEVNIELGARYLARQLARAKGDTRLALMRYNGTAAYADLVLARRAVLERVARAAGGGARDAVGA